MLNWLRSVFAPKRAPEPALPYWTPERVEAAIDRAGRQECFAAARMLGWSVDNPPPLWVWGQIAWQVIERRHQRDLLTGDTLAMIQYDQHRESLKAQTLN